MRCSGECRHPHRSCAGNSFLLLLWQWSGDSVPEIAAADFDQQGGHLMTFTLSSAAFVANGKIPLIHTCDGKDISPPLSLERGGAFLQKSGPHCR